MTSSIADLVQGLSAHLGITATDDSWLAELFMLEIDNAPPEALATPPGNLAHHPETGTGREWVVSTGLWLTPEIEARVFVFES